MTSQDFERYADLKSFAHFSSGSWADTLAEAIRRCGRSVSELRLLDIGCGDGKYFNYLCGIGCTPSNIHGVEVSRKRVERCQALGWTNAAYLAPGQPLPYADGSFDVVNLMEVIEHVPADQAPALVADITRVLTPDGMLLISTPNYPIKRFYDIYSAFRFGKWARLKDDPTHVTFYNHHRLSALLGTQFSVMEEKPYKQGFLFEKWPRPFLRHKMFYLCSKQAAS